MVPSRGAVRPLGLAEVRLTGGFWSDRQRLVSSATLDHGRLWMDKLGWTGNFLRAGGAIDRRGREFSDSEVYKLVEAMSWETGRAPQREREREIAELVGSFAAAQAPDGYLHTAFGAPGQPARYSDLAWGHELYCTGHLIQAAVARTRTSDDDSLLRVARKAADHVCDTFGPDGMAAICGHPEIEPALAELARLTGEQRYLDQAALFVRRRGNHTLPPHQFGWAYFSDDQPVRDATVFRGHAVRALYLAAGAVDVAVETGDGELLESIAAQFDRTLARRTYITGGMGSRHTDEAYGDDFVLPADRAYSETCAGVAAIMVAWRLLLATGQSRYADIIERILYNVVATSLGDDGRSFFYANTLHQRTPTFPVPDDEEQLGFGGGPRAPWFEVSCCLANISRLIASLSAYVAGVHGDELWLYQYADAEIRTALGDGRAVGLRVETRYPDDAAVKATVTFAQGGGPWAVALRIPPWAASATATLNGAPVPVEDGRVVVRDQLRMGDVILVNLPMTPRFVHPDLRIDAVRGCVAVEQGPLVLCAEAAPDGVDLDAIHVRTDEPVMSGSVAALMEKHDRDAWPYAEDVPHNDRMPVTVPLVPYHRWGRRGPVTMRVWLPTA